MLGSQRQIHSILSSINTLVIILVVGNSNLIYNEHNSESLEEIASYSANQPYCNVQVRPRTRP